MTRSRTARRSATTAVVTGVAVTSLAAAALAAGASALHPADQTRASTDVHGAGLARYGAPVRDGSVAQPDSATSFNATLPNGRRVTPAGVSVHVGENPLGAALTPDGAYLIVSNNDDRNSGAHSTAGTSRDATNGAGAVSGGHVLSVVDTATMHVVSSVPAPKNASPHPGSAIPGKSQSDTNTGQLFLGVVALPDGRVYAGGGGTDVVDEFQLTGGALSVVRQIPVPVPTDKSKPNYGMANPGGLTLGPDGKTLYVVENNANTVDVLDTTTDKITAPSRRVGYFPYAAAVADGKLFVSNWGVADRHFLDGAGTGTVDANGNVVHATSPYLGSRTANAFTNPATDEGGSSLSVLSLTGGTGRTLSLAQPIDGVSVVGGTHPSALATAGKVLYVADANDDTLALVDTTSSTVLGKLDLPSPIDLRLGRNGGQDGAKVGPPTGGSGGPSPFGLSPDALATSPDGSRLYVAEAGANDVAVFDTRKPSAPKLLGRIPTGWYPTALTISPDGSSLFITNSKGAGSPYGYQGTRDADGGNTAPDVNLVFGSVQKVDLATTDLAAGAQTVAQNTYSVVSPSTQKIAMLQKGIQHIVYILRENKTYDTYLGDDAVLNSHGARGNPGYALFGRQVPNLKKLAETYAVGDNAYADAEESDAGHSFALAGTSTDYQQKTLLARGSRPFINTKNEDPEDYPLRGYLFNAMERGGKSYRDYGDMIRVSGYDEGNSNSPCQDDPHPGCDDKTYPYAADKSSPTVNLGGRFSENVPALRALAGHIDESYPGWNLRISDQRRAKEFIRDFSAAAAAGSAPQFTFLWLPEDHTGGCAPVGVTAAAASCTSTQQVADADTALGQVMDYLQNRSGIWTSTAVFLTQDDAQGSPDHIAAHRSYTVVASPFAKKGKIIAGLSSTVSVAKTIEEILDLPAMNYGDLVANDLLDYFADGPSTSAPIHATRASAPAAPAEALRIDALTRRLSTTTYDADSTRIGQVNSLFVRSVALAGQKGRLPAAAYAARQDALYREALVIVSSPKGQGRVGGP